MRDNLVSREKESAANVESLENSQDINAKQSSTPMESSEGTYYLHPSIIIGYSNGHQIVLFC